MLNENMAVALTRGSKYHVLSLGTKERMTETTGKFLGYTSVGGDEGMVIELGDEHADLKGVLRVLPLHMIIAIDILQPAEDIEEKKEDKTPMFG